MAGSRLAGLVLVAGLVAGCGVEQDSGGEFNQYCEAVAKDSPLVCNNCVQVSNAGQAFDGRLSTAAQMGVGGQGGLQGTAARQPAGSVAGAYMVLASNSSLTVVVKTFLGGTPQEQSGTITQNGATQSCPQNTVCVTGTDGQAFFGYRTTKAYDTFRVELNNTGNSSININELCVRDADA